jgi:phage baseplate assembly protein W
MTKLNGISPKVPLIYDPTDGPYQLNKNLKQTINQNLKMLVLTSPGERIMVPEFGVGLRRFLFEQVNDDTFSNLADRIVEQTNFYLPIVNIEKINFITSDENPALALNEVQVSIKYNILPYDGTDQLLITSELTN